MKIEFWENRTITLIPENVQDKAWILSFAKYRGKKNLDWGLTFKRDTISGSSRGDCDVEEFEEGTLDWENLESLQIHSFDQ